MRIKKFNIHIGSQLFKSLGEEPRIRILNLLLEFKEISISDLEHILDYSQTKTSRHISYLKNHKILNSKKVEQWTFYYINTEIEDFVKATFQFMKNDIQLLKDIEIFRIMNSNRVLAKNKLELKKYRTNSIS